MKAIAYVTFAVGAVVIILAGVLGFVVLPNLVDNTIEKELQLVRGTDVWNKWVDIVSPIYLNFYIYNVTNPDEVEAGQPPILQDVGPYAYKQRRRKIDPHSKTVKETVEYQQEITYFFDQKKSGNLKETDVVNIFNMPFVSIIAAVQRSVGNTTAGSIANYALKAETLVKRNVLVGDVTFNGFDVSNYDSDLLQPLPEEFSGKRFGVYKGRNGSTDGIYEIYTGAYGADQFGLIKEWNRNSSLSVWNSDEYECNKLEGTDGSIFPPFVDKKDPIVIFNSDLCRTLKLDFQKEVTVKEIKAYRFSPKKEVLAGPAENVKNTCYCLKADQTECQSGTIDISRCRKGAPIVLSTPHFLDGDEGLSQDMGLTPKRALHETIIDIEPRTGLLLGAHKRIQINIEVNPIGTVNAYAAITKRRILPVVWVDEEVSMGDIDADDFKSRIEQPIKTINIARWVIIGVGIALVLFAILLFVFANIKSSSHV